MSTLFLFNIVKEVLATAITQEKETKGIQVGREEEKVSLFTEEMMSYIENLKVSTQKLLELINEFSEVAAYKINMQKSVTFLSLILNYQKERESKKTIPFTMYSKRMK